MSHVAEGELHAWLDGALDELGEERAAEVREHLRRCPACRQSLIAEEASRARASEVLGYAAPRAGELPPLEALIERARGASSPPGAEARPALRPRMSRAARLGWAASVVVALGAGWTARELGLRGGADLARSELATGPAADERQAAEARPPAEPAEAASPVEPAPSPVEPAAGPQVVAPPAAPAAQLARAESREVAVQKVEEAAFATAAPAAATLGADVGGRAAAGRAADLADEVRAAPPPAAAPGSSMGALRARTGNAGARRQAVEEAAEEAAAEAPAEAEPAPARVEVGTGAGALGIQRARAENARSDVPNLFVEGRAVARPPQAVSERAGAEVSSEADPEEAIGLIVPGLDVLDVRWLPLAPGRTALRVLQQLPAGDTLEIRFVRGGGSAAVPDPLAAFLGVALPEGWSQALRLHRDGWIVARARLAGAELEALVERVGEEGR